MIQEPDPLSVLAIISSSTVFQTIRPFLTRSNLAVTRATNIEEGLGLQTAAPCDLVVAQYPLSGFSPGDFFAAYYQPETATAETPLLVVTRSNRQREIQPHLSGRRARACYLEATDDGHLHQALYELIGVSARCASRLLLTAEVDFRDTTVERVYQTVNVSKTGFLARADRPLDPGTVLPLRLQLPGLGPPLRALAEVVRTVESDEEEEVSGFGARFLDFEADGRQQLTDYVEQRLALTTH